MKNKIIYQLTTDDIQRVAVETINRELTVLELFSITDKIAERIPWYDVISEVITETFDKNEQKDK
jgi:hypothetical protein